MDWWTILNVQTVLLFGFTTLFVSLRRPPSPMGAVLTLTQASAFVWALGELLSVLSPDLASKQAALVLLHTGGIWLPFSWFLLAVRFAEAHGVPYRWATPAFCRAVAVFTVLLWLVAATNPWHGLYLEPVVHDWNERKIGWVIAAVISYLELCIVLVLYVGLIRDRNLARGVRRQALLLAGASVSPLIALLVGALTGPHRYPIEPGTLGGTIGGVLILLSIYSLRLFNLSPTAVSSLITQDPAALLLYDARGRLRFASAAAAQLLPEAVRVVGRSTLQQMEETLDLPGQPAPPIPLGFSLRRVGGARERWLWCDVEAIEDARGEGAGRAVWIDDITVLQEMEVSRTDLVERLRESRRLARLGSLATQFAHAIGSPVGAIQSDSHRALERSREQGDGVWVDEALQRVIDEAERGARLVRGVLAYARERGEESGASDSVSLADLSRR